MPHNPINTKEPEIDSNKSNNVDFDTAFSKISALVKDFKQNEKRYLSSEYQEAEVRLLSLETRRALAQVKPTTIVKLPIVLFNDKNYKARENLIIFVDQMLEAKKQLQIAKTDRDKTYYERKCDSLDKQINSEVYKLYELTDEEIKIVESENK
jgi:hypothetical protein